MFSLEVCSAHQSQAAETVRDKHSTHISNFANILGIFNRSIFCKSVLHICCPTHLYSSNNKTIINIKKEGDNIIYNAIASWLIIFLIIGILYGMWKYYD